MALTWRDYTLLIFAFLVAIFSFYTGATGVLVPPAQRGLHVLLIFPVIFFLKDSGFFKGVLEDIFNLFLTLISCVTFGFYVLNWERLYSDPTLSTLDITMGIAGILIVLEVTRRTVGYAITGIILVFLLYALYGRYIPSDFLAHRGFSVEQIVYLVFYGTEGIFSVPVGVCATFIVMIVIFGGFLNTCGGSEFFMNIAKSIAGPAKGGPAKIAVIASGLMGMITGATVANIATTGSVTIPMMKKMGYKGEYAAAVEALASSGSQLAPPIMGAAVFIMVEFVMLPYIDVCYAAIAPAILFFLAIFMIVHFHSIKLKMFGIPRSECPKFFAEFKKGGHLLIPIILLVVLLSRWMDPMFAGFITIVCLVIVSWFKKETRVDAKKALEGIKMGVIAMAPLTAVCAAAGIIIGIMSMTGLGMRIAFLIEHLSHGYVFIALILTAIACIIMGMGLPTVAAYVVLASIVPSTLQNMGVSPLQAHLFIFYFAILSAITPPVCTGAYTAAGIANSNPLKTGVQAVKLGFVAFLLPFVFVYDNGILWMGSLTTNLLATFFTATGIICWAGTIEGFFFSGRLNTIERVLIGIFAIMQIIPNNISRITGLAGVIVLGLIAWKSKRIVVNGKVQNSVATAEID